MKSSELTRKPIKISQTELYIRDSKHSDDLRVLNDKVSSRVFGCDEDEWEDVVTDQKSLSVMEREPRKIGTPGGKSKVVSKDVAEVQIRMRIKNTVDECIRYRILREPLNNFDKAVLEACMTHMYKGKGYITFDAIFEYLGGKREPSDNMRQQIEDSVDKLRFIDIRLDVTQAYENLKRLQKPDGTPKREFKQSKPKPKLDDYLDEIDCPSKSAAKKKPKYRAILSRYLLPADVLTVTMDGRTFTAVKFLDISPLFLYADDKGETMLLEQKLLRPKELNNTKRMICMKEFILLRVNSIKRSRQGGGKPLNPVITFDSIYEACVKTQAALNNRDLRKSLRDSAFEYLKFLRVKGHITDFDCLDDDDVVHSNLAECSKFSLDM